jgi:hypothetical protein
MPSIIAELQARTEAPGLNMNDADLMRRAVAVMTSLFEDNCRLAQMASKTEPEA